MDYSEQLKTWQWKEKREIILDRDMYMCQQCMSRSNLQVHHITYIDGKMAWEYSNDLLITLCGSCHALKHDKLPKDHYEKSWQFIRRSVAALNNL